MDAGGMPSRTSVARFETWWRRTPMNVSARELLRNGVKDKLARDELVVSMTVKLVRTVEIAAIARTAGFDSLYIDVEHSSFSLDTTSQICMAALAVGVTPFVRVPSTAPDAISRALDGGALGIIAPHVQSPEDAARIVHLAKFAPLGDRSFTGSLPHFQFRSFPTTEMFEALNDDLVVAARLLPEVAGTADGPGEAVRFVQGFLAGSLTNDSGRAQKLWKKVRETKPPQ